MNKKIEKAKVIEILEKCKAKAINEEDMLKEMPLIVKMTIVMDRINTINKIKKEIEKEI